MRVSDFDTFETEGLLTGTKERSWIWFGLIVSLAIHFALCAYFYRTRFAPMEAAVAQNEQTPMFKVRSITESNLDKSSADQTTQAAKPNPDNTDVHLSQMIQARCTNNLYLTTARRQAARSPL